MGDIDQLENKKSLLEERMRFPFSFKFPNLSIVQAIQGETHFSPLSLFAKSQSCLEQAIISWHELPL